MQSNQSNAPIGVNSYGQTTGTVQTSPFITVFATRDPTTYDFNYPIKQRWINTSKALDPVPQLSEFILYSFNNVTGQNLATWIPITAGTTELETLTGNSGGAVFPLNNNIDVVGDGTTINIVGNPSTHTLTASLVGGLPAIQTIDGDTGSVSGNTIQLYGQTGSANAGGSVKFVASSATEMDLVVTDIRANTFIGESSGSPSASGANNTSVGHQSLTAITSSSGQSFFGSLSGFSATTGSGANCGFGSVSLNALTTGLYNNAVGFASLQLLLSGSYNQALGYLAGISYVGAESSNIVISNNGVASESNVTRIGTQGNGNGQQNKCFIAGITGVTAVGSPVAVSSTGQLSDLGFGTTGQLLTSNGAGVSPTWQNKISGTNVFTATLSFGGASTGITYSQQGGYYNLVGNVVFFAVGILLTNKGSATGQAVLNGLPLAIFRHTDCSLNMLSGSIPSTACNLLGILDPSIPNGILFNVTTTGSPNTGAAMDDTYFNNNTSLLFWGQYWIS